MKNHSMVLSLLCLLTGLLAIGPETGCAVAGRALTIPASEITRRIQGRKRGSGCVLERNGTLSEWLEFESEGSYTISVRARNLDTTLSAGSILRILVDGKTVLEKEVLGDGRELYRVLVNLTGEVHHLIIENAQPDINFIFEQALNALREKHYEKAIFAFKRIVGCLPRHPGSHYNIACAYSMKGNTQQALRWLEKAIRCGFHNLDHIRSDPDLNHIRESQEFKKLMRDFEELAAQAQEKDGADTRARPARFYVESVTIEPGAEHAAPTRLTDFEANPGPWSPAILKQGAKQYLPNFSYAGYRWAELPLPEARGKVISVTNYGAAGDDDKDDTAAIQKALSCAHKHNGPVIVEFPKGRFIVKQILWIRRSNLVLRGAGSGKDGTVLYMPDSMERMELPESFNQLREYLVKTNKKARGKLYSLFSWTGGIIWTQKTGSKPKLLSKITAGKRGAHQLSLENPVDLKPGTVVQIRWYNREGKESTLLAHIFDDQEVPLGERLYDSKDRALVTQPVTVASTSGKTVTVKEEFLHDLRPEWMPQLFSIDYLEEVGIERLQIEFPETRYRGHHLEAGFNAIYLTGLIHSWTRDVKIINADSGILSDGCKNVTIEDVHVGGRGGHYTVMLGSCSNMLVRNFRFAAPALHNPSFGTYSKLNVYTDGEIHEARFDQHCGLNHQNLFDNLRITNKNPTPLFVHGGSDYWRPTAGAFNTFWNILVDFENPAPVNGVTDAPSARLVALRGCGPLIIPHYGPNAYIEGLNRPGITVPSLYNYQLDRRLSRAGNADR